MVCQELDTQRRALLKLAELLTVLVLSAVSSSGMVGAHTVGVSTIIITTS